MPTKNYLKKGLIFTIIAALMLLSTPIAMANDNPIKLVVNGEEVATDVAPQLVNGRTMVPVRVAGQALGETILWDQEKQAVLINSSSSQAGPREDVIQLIVDGQRMNPEVPPMLINGRTMVPIRFIGEALNADVRWEQATRTVYITTKGPKPTIEKIVVGPNDKKNWDAETIEERYADAMNFSILDNLHLVDYDSVIARNGTHFVNNGADNAHIRIGYANGKGQFDFGALTGVTGEIGVHINATVDVRNTSRGMYLKMKDSVVGEEKGYITYRYYIDYRNYDENTGRFDELIKLSVNIEHVENAYLDILLPPGAEITIHDIFMYLEDEVPGFGDMAERITGGEGATPENIHVVHNVAEFVEAIDLVKQNDEPSIIYVNGTLEVEDWKKISGGDHPEIHLGNTNNLSIIGVADRAVLNGLGLRVQGHNIIVENLTIQYIAGQNGIQVNGGSYIWVRHNSLIDYDRDLPTRVGFDELMNIKNDANHVIVSWNHFKDSNRGLLVGSNDGVEGLVDRRVIIHHNHFESLKQRIPLYRGGFGHFYNNFINDSSMHSSNIRGYARVRLENNYYKNAREPIGDFHTSNQHNQGRWEVINNIYDNSTGSQPTESTIHIKFKDYVYEVDPVEDVPRIVSEGAGAGKIEQDIEYIESFIKK